jgi:glutamate decarboxylase
MTTPGTSVTSAQPSIPSTNGATDRAEVSLRPEFAQPGELSSIPRLQLAEAMLPAGTAYQLVHDELMLDHGTRLNLATFVGTWMEPQARILIEECLDRNIVDRDECPQTAELERRCLSILADLWHSPEAREPTGCSTTGSSEACMLGGLALKWRWRERRKAAGKSTDRPNLVMGANVQICWEKFCRYWDIEPRKMPLEPGRTCLTADAAAALCDENTIGVLAILGSTFDGSYEPVAEISRALDGVKVRTGLDVPIHVDAASGGFVAPFLDPELEWDFRLPRVQSINASGHKYGLVYPNLGWVIWRDDDGLPEDLRFNVDYLGGTTPTFSLNFSRAAFPVIAQYYTMVRLGQEGFRRVQLACRDTARWLAEEIMAMGRFVLLGDGSTIPVLAFRLADDVQHYSVFDISELLRLHRWQVPAYTLPANLQDTAVLRMVIRNGFGRDLAQLVAQDLRRVTEQLDQAGPLPPHGRRTSFHH